MVKLAAADVGNEKLVEPTREKERQPGGNILAQLWCGNTVVVWRYSYDDDEDNHEEAKRNKLSISAHGRMMHGNDAEEGTRRRSRTWTVVQQRSGNRSCIRKESPGIGSQELE